MSWKDIFSPKNIFEVTQDDQAWVEECFENLMNAFGYPTIPADIQWSEKYFPSSYNTLITEPELVLDDLCSLLDQDKKRFEIVLIEDLRDSGLDYAYEGNIFEAEVVIGKDRHIIHLANSVISNPNRLLYILAKELIVFTLQDRFANYDKKEDESLLAYIAAIWFGFGTVFGNNLVYHGFETSLESTTSWVNHAVMPPQVFGYALAYMEKLVFQSMYSFKGDVGRYYKSAVRYLEQKDVRLVNKQEHDALEFAHLSYDASEEHDWERARELALKALFQTQDIYLQSDLNNCIGYSWLMNRDYDKAIGYFERALELNIGNAFALDNMGFSYLQLGDLELGRSFIEKAISTSGNDEGYSYRNLALYYWKKGDLVTAGSHFQKAIKHKGMKVDLLDELYQKFIAEFDVK